MTHDLRKRIERLEAARTWGEGEQDRAGEAYAAYLSSLSHRDFWAEATAGFKAGLACIPGALDPHPDDPPEKADLRASIKAKVEGWGVAGLDYGEARHLSGFLMADGQRLLDSQEKTTDAAIGERKRRSHQDREKRVEESS